ncbi:MAG: hypothetical protein AAB426_01985 [Myxococcota bacterium]
MDQVEFRLRAPTGTAWLATAALLAATGELHDELRKPGPAMLFRQRIDDGVLLPVVIVFGLVTLLSLAWLASLYLVPGRLRLDVAAGTLARVRRKGPLSRALTAPLASWRVALVYYREEDRLAGHFKRLELSSAALHEVLLFGDLRDGEALGAAITALREQFESFDVRVEKP